MTETADVLARLVEIANELEPLQLRESALYREQTDLWAKGHAEGIATAVMARASRVEPTTIRSARYRAAHG